MRSDQSDSELYTDTRCRPSIVGVAALSAANKEKAIEELVRRVLERVRPNRDTFSAPSLIAAALEREALGSTLVADMIAFPHAVIPELETSVVVLGVTESPILWDPPDKRARVIALFVGSPECHLPIMSQLARLLRDQATLTEVLGAQSDVAIEEAIRRRFAAIAPVRTSDGDEQNDQISTAAADIAAGYTRAGVALVSATFGDTELLATQIDRNRPDLLLAPENEENPAFVGVPVLPTLPQLRHDERTIVAMLERARSRNEIDSWDTLIVLSGEPRSNRITHLFVHTLADRGERSLPHGVQPIVFDRAVQIARDLALEGREGKPVGVIIVIGSIAEIETHSHQMIINPFAGLPVGERNILDPGLEETVKEFAKIDGAFVVGGDGVIASAGTYLSVARQDLNRRGGQGARHASAQAISAVCACVAIVVSESTRRMTVFQDGEPVEAF